MFKHLLRAVTLFLTFGWTLISCGAEDGKETGQASSSPTVVANAAGILELIARDNLFEFHGRRRPNIEVRMGQETVVNLVNNGTAAHNLRIVGMDGQYDTQDDIVSRPEIIRKGERATLSMKLDKAGTYNFRCDYHATEMAGVVTVR